MILLADIGATNARFCVTADSFKYQNSDSFKVEQYSSLEELCIGYLNKYQLDTKVKKAVIGVAAPIACLLYTSPSPRDLSTSRMPSSA